jgi:hypothetical protein
LFAFIDCLLTAVCLCGDGRKPSGDLSVLQRKKFGNAGNTGRKKCGKNKKEDKIQSSHRAPELALPCGLFEI